MATARDDTDMHREFDDITHPAVRTVREDETTIRVEWGKKATFRVIEWSGGVGVCWLTTHDSVDFVENTSNAKAKAYAVYGIIASEVGMPS